MAVDLKKIRGLGPDELAKESQALREEVWKLRMQQATGQLEDPGKIRKKRHDLARVLTIIREAEIAGSGK